MLVHGLMVKPISTILNYLGRNRKDPWDGRWVEAMRDCRANGGNAALINLKIIYFERRKAKLPKETDDGFPMATYCSTNNGEF